MYDLPILHGQASRFHFLFFNLFFSFGNILSFLFLFLYISSDGAILHCKFQILQSNSYHYDERSSPTWIIVVRIL